jgi:hypothetical protein
MTQRRSALIRAGAELRHMEKGSLNQQLARA